jgi:hypothetical protein
MSNINKIFQSLADYLEDNKTVLYEVERISDNHPDHARIISTLSLQRETLNDIKNKLVSYSDDVNSAMQHIDSILAQNSSGGRRLTKRRKGRKGGNRRKGRKSRRK